MDLIFEENLMNLTRRTLTALALLASIVLLSAAPSEAGVGVVLGQVDDFEDLTEMGWAEGNPAPNPPINVPNGGPNGAGDAYLQNTSTGTPGPGGKMVMFNFLQWTGDYSLEGVNLITADMQNFAPAQGGATLFMRIAVEGGPSGTTRYGSVTAQEVSIDGAWHPVVFDLNDLSLISGTDSLSQVLADVGALRILSAESGPSWTGDEIAATLGVDNISATRVPISGMLAGMGLRTLQCRNNTTGQKITLEQPGLPWDCEAAGLVVNPGDRISVQLHGSAE